MPAIGRKRNTTKKEAGIVKELPVLPYPLFKGRISWSDEFDGEPTGTIEYEGLTEAEIDNVQAAYQPGAKITLYGIQFYIKRFGYSRVPADVVDEILDIFTASISLECVPFEIDDEVAERARMFGFISYADRVAVPMATPVNPNDPNGNYLQSSKMLNIKAIVDQAAIATRYTPTSGWSQSSAILASVGQSTKQSETLKIAGSQFGGVRSGLGTLFVRDEIISDGLNEIEDSQDGYNDATLSGGWEQDEPRKNAPNGPATVFTLVPPKRTSLEDYSKDWKRPPENTYVLRDDTSQNFDENGQKKIYRRIDSINGQSDREVIETWGFAYLYKDIVTADGERLYYDSPENFWQVVEYRETRYIYRPGGSATFSIAVKSEDGKTINYNIHPDYNQFASLGLGTVTLRSQAEFLVETETTGWKLCRFKRESKERNSLDPDDPYTIQGLYDFKKVPFISRTVYLLSSARLLQGSNTSQPFSIEYVDYENAETRIKQAFNVKYDAGMAPQGLVIAVIKPDPNFVEPFYVKVEGSASNCFIWADDPEGEVNPDAVLPGTNIPLPPPRLISGEESFNEVRRTITGADTYTELVTQYSSQDPGFDNSIERITISEKTGQPPSPTNRIYSYESTQLKIGGQDPGTGSSQIYTMNTANSSKVEAGGSASYPLATSPEEGKLAAEVDLRKRNMQNNQAQKTIFNFYPQLRAGQPISCEADRFAGLGQWRIMSINWTLEYKGIVDGFGLLVTTPGTQLTLGLDKHSPISLGSKLAPEQDPQNDDNGYGNPNADVDAIAYPGELGAVLPTVQTRRNF